MSNANQPTVIVLFGVSGDLAKRYILPALYHLLKDGLLPSECRIIGTTRQPLSKAALLKNVELCILDIDKACDPKVLKRFNNLFELIQFNPVDADEYSVLKARLNELEKSRGACFNRLFYLSIPPQVYGPIVRLLGESGLAKSCEHGKATSRLLVEKPFGYDLKSAKELIKQTAGYFAEEQIFRIDHFLAKETAQNILFFRKNNPLFKDLWDNRLIRRIQVRALESLDIEGRVNFYDNLGALRDIVQSHLLQLMAISTMQLPKDISSASEIHQQKIKLLNHVTVKNSNTAVIRGQYAGYLKEVNNPDSKTETYIKLNLAINSHKWAGVPIILITGKALKAKTSDIIIDFSLSNSPNCNQLTIRLQPHEGIDIRLFVKKPGYVNTTQSVTMDFSYQSSFESQSQPSAYERVIVDAIHGDQSLFASSREVIRNWEILQPVLDAWQKSSADLVIYPKGSNGPILSDDLVN